MTGDPVRRVFLTGASSGIGLETARLLCARGCRVWATSRDPARLPSLDGLHPVTMNLTSIESIRTGFARAREQAGAFEVLINNAGAGWFGPVAHAPPEILQAQFDLLVGAPLELIRLALPGMRERGRGLLINVSSIAAIFPIPFMTPYSAAKAALSSFTVALRAELARTSIRVVDVQPGDTRTPFHDATRRFDGALEADDRAPMEAVWNEIGKRMRTAPAPGLVAQAIVRVVESRNPPRLVRVGTVFQARFSPFAARFVPESWVGGMLRRYYGL